MGYILTEAGGHLLDESGAPLLTESYAGYPDEPLDATVELLLDGTWTDVTQWATPGNDFYGQISSGQPDGSQQVMPASMLETLDNGDARFSIRNESGPYYGNLKQNVQSRVSVAAVWGTYLRLEGTVADIGDGGDYASTPNATALHVTGSLEARIGLMLSDWGPCTFAGRWGSSGTPAWIWGILDDGTLQFGWHDSSGTDHNAISTASLPYQPGATAVRVTLNTSTGAVSFYYAAGQSIDPGSWTQLGSTVSGTGATAAAGDQPLIVGYSAYGGVMANLLGDVYDFRLYNGIGGTVVADAGFSAQPGGTTSWTDSAGLAWGLSGVAEISGRDYRLHGELSTESPTVASSGAVARVAATVSGRLRRLQQGQAPPSMSPMKRGLLAASGDLACVQLWPCEDGSSATQLASAIPGASAMTFVSGTPKLASSTPFGAASMALPQVNGAEWHGSIPSYTANGAIVVRALVNFADTAPSGDYWSILRLVLSGSDVYWVDVVLTTSGGMNLALVTTNSSLTQIGNSGTLSFSPGGVYADNDNFWVSIEGRVVSGDVVWTLTTLTPGAPSGNTYSLPGVSTSLGTLTDVYVNPYGAAIDSSVVGMISFQSAWESMFDLAPQLNAYGGELAATRFYRTCAEESITARVIGPQASSAAMGPQPTGSVYSILTDCAAADGGILFEPRTTVGVGMRTKASMLAQPTAVTLSFADANLPGTMKPTDDDMMPPVNDLTASDGYGNTVRYQLNDGSNKSVSEPPTGIGEYATTATLNVAEVSQLPGAAAWYVAVRTSDNARYKGIDANFGIPGAPVTDMARLRPGDRVVVESPPVQYQTADITQVQMGATETLGPGRNISWDCWPSAPWDSA